MTTICKTIIGKREHDFSLAARVEKQTFISMHL